MLRYAFAALLLFRCIAPALAQTPNSSKTGSNAPGVKMQYPVAGDHWTYEVKDGILGTLKLTRTDIVTDLSKNEINVRVDAAKTGPSRNIIYDHSWDILRDGPFKYTPNDGMGIRLPLAVGAQWKFATDVSTLRYGTTFRRVGTSRVVRQESLTTKAGTFNTFVVETDLTSRSVKDPTLVNQTVRLTWFDPDIDHWVKRSIVLRQRGHVVENDTVELIDYGRKKE